MVIFVKFDFVVLVDYGMSHLQARNGKYKWKNDVIIFFYMLKMSFTCSVSLGLLWFFWYVCHCLLILCFIHDMFCIQSKNVLYYFCFVNFTLMQNNMSCTTCSVYFLHTWVTLFSDLYIFITLSKKKKKKNHIQNTVSEIDIWFEVFLRYLSYIIEL